MEAHESIDWMKRGYCKDMQPDLFFSRIESDEEIAKLACGSCAVRQECLAYAIEHRIDHGIWGGSTEEERRQLRRSTKRVTHGAA